MQSKATTVAQYLAGLPGDRRAAISAVRDVILANLDKDYEEGMQYGMIGYYIPHRIFPAGYHCDPRVPLPFASLASQKNHMALYLMAAYGEDSEGNSFRAAWAKTGKKLDMGKSCVRFKRVEDLALDVIGDAIRRMPARAWIEIYRKTIDNRTPMPREEIRAMVAKRKAAAAKASAVKKAARSKSRAPAGAKSARGSSSKTARARASGAKSRTR
jgi:hypothetical protein